MSGAGGSGAGGVWSGEGSGAGAQNFAADVGENQSRSRPKWVKAKVGQAEVGHSRVGGGGWEWWGGWGVWVGGWVGVGGGGRGEGRVLLWPVSILARFLRSADFYFGPFEFGP